MENVEGGSAPQIRVATTDQATAWIGGGWRIFKQAPGVWIAMLLVYFIISFIVGLIPVIGSLAMTLCVPVFTLGWMQGVKDVEAGNTLKVTQLFSGFQSPRMGNLVILGLLSLGIAIGIALIVGLGMFSMFWHDGQLAVDDIGVGALILAFVAMLLGLLLAAAFLFAAPLVGFDGMAPVAAVKLSFAAAFKNWLSLLIWSLLAMLLCIVGAIPFGLGLLVVIPLLANSYYLVYRDIFTTV